jgi:type IV pilus biogenesis protein CpaD/CtpE
VILLLIPMTLASLAALLFLTDALERRSSDVLVRMAIKSPRSSFEATETLVAGELARRLEAAGLGQRPVAEVARDAHVAPAVVERVIAAAQDDTGEIPIADRPLSPAG